MGDLITPKKAGYCSLCDAPFMEVVEKYVTGPLAGEVKKFGAMMPGAYRATFVLLSGAHSDISFCAKCKPTPENLPFIWKRVLFTTALCSTDESRKNHDLAPYTSKQREAMEKELDSLLGDLPLGVLYTQTWKEVFDGGQAS